jgi:hypothetical protein
VFPLCCNTGLLGSLSPAVRPWRIFPLPPLLPHGWWSSIRQDDTSINIGLQLLDSMAWTSWTTSGGEGCWIRWVVSARVR